MALRVVIDTNILLVSISDRSPHHWIFEDLRRGLYSLLVSTEIALEYEEVIGREMGDDVASVVLGAFERYPNVLPVHRYYLWNLIKSDFDDNKFTDCAIAGGADCLVTNDKHFNVLQDIDFPRVTVVTPEEFKILLTKTQQSE